VILVRTELPMNDKLPILFLKSPTVVRLGVLKVWKKFSSKVREPFTVTREGTLSFETFRKVALLAQMRLGRSTSRDSELAEKLRLSVTLASCVVNWVRRLLLLISKTPTVTKLIPTRLFMKVLVMITLPAIVTKAGKVGEDRTGRVSQWRPPTVVNSVNWTVESWVRLFRSIVPLMEPIELLVS